MRFRARPPAGLIAVCASDTISWISDPTARVLNRHLLIFLPACCSSLPGGGGGTLLTDQEQLFLKETTTLGKRNHLPG